MMQILYRPMVKEALVLVTAGVVATLICSSVYAAPLSDAQKAAPAEAPADHQLAPVPQDLAREQLLAAIRGQTSMAAPTPASGR
jgi:hypothetical protein